MKTLVIYFSQTGNTRKVAECIRDGIMSVTGQCDLTNLADIDADSLADYDLVGLGCPVFYYKEPFVVRDCLDGLPELSGRHWFIFCTHGSAMGNTFHSMAERLQKKGITVIGYHDTYADVTVPFFPHPAYTTGHPDSQDLGAARAFSREIAERSQRIAEGDRSLIPKPEPAPEDWVQMAQILTPEFLESTMPQFRIDMEKCTHCHACEDNCPVKGIDVGADPPRIQSPCTYCLYCWNVCPTLAIEADWDVLATMAPESYGRFRQVLDEASARGEFRWLVDPDSIDFNEPLYKQRERELRTKAQDS